MSPYYYKDVLLPKLIKLIDQLAAPALIALLRKTVQFNTVVPIHSILIVRPGGIGDAVLLLPMLQQLSLLYPDAKLEILAERRNAEVFSWSPVVSAVWCYDRPLEFLDLIRRRRYDLVIDTEQWYRLSAVVARLLCSSKSIGFVTNERGNMFTDTCPYLQNMYEAEMFLKLLAPLHDGVSVSAEPWEEAIVLPPAGFKCCKPYVVLFPGASVATKQWSADRFAEVARCCEENGFVVVIVGGKAEEHSSHVISDKLCNGINFVGKTSLTESTSIVAGATLMISVDSGLLHIAQQLGVPTVALFGPSNSNKWSRLGGQHAVVSAGVNCSPCSQFGVIPQCPYDCCCMHNITIEMVVDAASHVLQKSSGVCLIKRG